MPWLLSAVERLGASSGCGMLEVNNAGREEMNLWFNAADLLLVGISS
ncbi:MAG: hypothetical protein MZV63_47095 [Marinilabiliales bacterium]|nr:hypothetical protein [Marinilabiliales bacterium]